MQVGVIELRGGFQLGIGCKDLVRTVAGAFAETAFAVVAVRWSAREPGKLDTRPVR